MVPAKVIHHSMLTCQYASFGFPASHTFHKCIPQQTVVLLTTCILGNKLNESSMVHFTKCNILENTFHKTQEVRKQNNISGDFINGSCNMRYLNVVFCSLRPVVEEQNETT